MHKGEIIWLHVILFKIRKMLETCRFTGKYFQLYDKLSVFPSHIHKRKVDHKKAIFILCLGILEVLHEKPMIVTECGSINLSEIIDLSSQVRFI
ncbi:hypothetical protein DRP05_10910 [Archaeoglobales archaeon]|nr:MAG: hypothetical protein DRP05_10910 [Archaeoglobales archaeon]